MTTTDFQNVLDRSSVRLDATTRDILSQGRTMRCRNRDGEYATVMTDRLADEITDGRADYIISIASDVFDAITGDPYTIRLADVFDRNGEPLGKIRALGPAEGSRGTTLGRVRTTLVRFPDLRARDLFCEQEADEQGRAVVFRATTDATPDGSVEAVVEGSSEARRFALGADYLAFKVLAH